MQSNRIPFMQYAHESGVVARWHGGEYIERTLEAFRAKVDERIAEESV